MISSPGRHLMHRVSALLLAGLLVACTTPDDTHDGTAVGNPGVVAFALGETVDMDVDFAEASAGWVGVRACGTDEEQAIQREDPMIPLDEQIAFELPLGTWCTLMLDDLQVYLEGHHGDAEPPDGGEFMIGLNLGATQVNAGTFDGFTVSADQGFVFELGSPGWVAAEDIGLDPDNEVAIDDQAPLHEPVALAMLDRSALYSDPNTDSVVSEEERDAGAAAAVTNDVPTEPEPLEGGGGCTAAGSGTASLWMLLGLLMAVFHRGASGLPLETRVRSGRPGRSASQSPDPRRQHRWRRTTLVP